MISEMSENDLKTLGHSVGFSPVLDYEVKSNCMIWYDYAVIKLNLRKYGSHRSHPEIRRVS